MKTVFFGLLIPFLGTAAGAACVFFLRRDLRVGVQRALTGFAAGVMVAASIWSLIVPAIDQSAAMGQLAFLPAFIGFWLGVLFLLLLDHVIPHLHRRIDQAEGPKSRLPRTAMMVLAVTLHNIPEGMAVGVVYAGLLFRSGSITAGGALALALGIAIQNFPEGAIISMPLYAEGKSKPHAFGLGILSGAELSGVTAGTEAYLRVHRKRSVIRMNRKIWNLYAPLYALAGYELHRLSGRKQRLCRDHGKGRGGLQKTIHFCILSSLFRGGRIYGCGLYDDRRKSTLRAGGDT